MNRSTMVFPAFLVVAACSGSAADSIPGNGGVRIPYAQFGGLVAIDLDDDSAMYGYFTSAVATSGDFAFEATETCILQRDISPTLNATYRDVGSQIGATAGAFSIFAAQQMNGSEITYQGFATGGAIDTFTVEVGGNAIGSIDMPRAPYLNDSSPLIVPGQPLSVGFGKSSGIDLAVISLQSNDGLINYSCFAYPDGEFTVPGDVTQAVGAGGFIRADFYSVSIADLDGRTVVLVAHPWG